MYIMILNVEYLDQISEKITKVKGTKKYFGLEPVIQTCLHNACHGKYSFKVNFVKVDPREKPFIMCVYPEPDALSSQMDDLLTALNKRDFKTFVQLWENFDKWVIEIDTRVLDTKSSLAVDDGDQFVALLCHEIGHVLNTHPVKLYHNYHLNKARMDMYEKMVMGERNYIWKVFLPMFVCIDGLRIAVYSPSNSISEIRADLSLRPKYKEAFVSYIENHILNNVSTAHGIVLTEEELDNEYQRGIEFSRECIRLMKVRRSILKAHIVTQYKLSPSDYFKDIYKLVHDAITGDDINTGKPNPRKEVAVVDKVNVASKTAQEKSQLILESKIVTDRDIALLMVESDAIETYDDKSFVLNSIFDYIEILQKNEAKLLKKTKGDVSTVLNPYEQKIKQLQDLKVKVMAKKIDPPTYGVYIKYPEGYEG